MAERKLLFLDSLGFPEEHASTDTSTFGGLTLGGDIAMQNNKVVGLKAGTIAGDALSYGQSGATLSGLDVSSQKITNLAPGTAGTDAVNLNQLNNAIEGLDIKESCRLCTTSDLGATFSASGGANGKGQFTGAPTSVDGVAVAQGDRILVKNQTNGLENGIYVVTATTSTWDRADDFDDDAEVTANAFTFVSEGNTCADTGWVLTTNDPITVNTTSQTWTQFSSAGVITAGAGLVQDGNAFDVNPGVGIEVVSDEVRVKLGATNPGLEFTTASGLQVNVGQGIELTSDGVAVDLHPQPGLEFVGAAPGGELRVLAAPSGCITVNPNGVAVVVDTVPQTLECTVSGLQVVGLPLGFKINDDQVSVNVTANNLDELTSGGVTNLHSHSGSDEAKRLENTFNADAAISIGDPVRFTSANGVTATDNTSGTSRRTVGIARTADGGGGTVEVVSDGLAAGVLSGATPGDAYFIDTPNGLTSTRPTAAGSHVYLMGFAANSTDLMLRFQYLGKVGS